MKTDLPFPLACAFIGIAVAGYSATHGSIFAYSRGPIDSALLIAALVLLAWLLSGRRSRLVGADAHEETRKSLAFRMGKALNGIRRGFRR